MAKTDANKPKIKKSGKPAEPETVAEAKTLEKEPYWQLTDDEGNPVVRERYWLTFQPGEIRVCGSCHGLSGLDQAGDTAPENAPQALLALLNDWKQEEPVPPVPDNFLYLPALK